MTLMQGVRHVGAAALACTAVSCAQPIIEAGTRAPQAKPTAPLSQLWVEPRDLSRRNLRTGSGQQAQPPSARVEYKVLKRDESGYSPGYDVVGPDGREWDVKIGKEAQTEVVLSRILWALGYHQPATYYLTGWRLAGEWEDEGEPARFRLESDHKNDGEWEWIENPFRGSRAMNALIAVNLLLSNWDLKTSNNRVYRARESGERRYVVQDLGASLGRYRIFPKPIGTRNEIDDFEQEPFIADVRGSEVALNYRGTRTDIFERLDVADVVWACDLMNRLGDSQLDDAFQAAGYEPGIRARFVKKIRAKIREGLALRNVATSPSASEGPQ